MNFHEPTKIPKHKEQLLAVENSWHEEILTEHGHNLRQVAGCAGDVTITGGRAHALLTGATVLKAKVRLSMPLPFCLRQTMSLSMSHPKLSQAAHGIAMNSNSYPCPSASHKIL